MKGDVKIKKKDRRDRDAVPKKGVWVRIDHTPEHMAVVMKLATAEANKEGMKRINDKLRRENARLSEEVRTLKEERDATKLRPGSS